MWFQLLFLCFIIIQTDGHRVQENADSDPKASDDAPRIVSPSGSFLGSWMETRRGRRFEAYRGIRYAEPAVGEFRFQPPKLIHHYEDEVDASKEGPACPLPATKVEIDEDCLRINVYTPRSNTTNLLPVIFYIHAGGFYVMTGRSDLAGPHYLLDRDIVLVTINYRLATLGFISTGDAFAPGNNGMKDQVAALRWVQKNIKSFGGDPGLVTITGCSAGSRSVMLHMVSPMSKGLFHRGISMSGSATSKAPVPHHQFHLAQKQAILLNCSHTNTSEEIIACLKSKPYRDLGYSLKGFFDHFNSDPVGLWTAVVEPDFGQERFLTMDPADAIREGKKHSVPYIISQTRNEFFWKALYVVKNESLLKTMNEEWERIAPVSFMLPPGNSSAAVRRLKETYLGDRKLVNDEATADGLGKLYGDAITGFPVHRMANLMCRYSTEKVYYAEFDYIGNHSHYEDPDTKKPIGVAHHDDLIYLFTLSYRFPTIEVSDSDDSQMVDKMIAIWYNFAKYGDPNPHNSKIPELSTLDWPAMTPIDRKYLQLGEHFTVREKLFEDRFQVWEELYPLQY
ncbi:juvenile hormone esterase-like [Achroia grisella]|uniref:juvenile hormone esterase-like n=1 Tax=Achroia grisella TaxID=688607 RepID=UPI0027D322A6|nr:juvenile hormone esterase-like [Achroia grisella]